MVRGRKSDSDAPDASAARRRPADTSAMEACLAPGRQAEIQRIRTRQRADGRAADTANDGASTGAAAQGADRGTRTGAKQSARDRAISGCRTAGGNRKW